MKTKNHPNNAIPPFALWLMGPTSSGKTTLAELLVKRLLGDGVTVIHFDGDEVRKFFD